ncbi:putative transcriptional regulator, partial [Geobacillus subterraneus]
MIKEMYERGMSISDIARELGIDRKTVRKYIHSPNPPSKSKRKQRKSKLDPFKPYLQKRMLEDGVLNSEKLFFEIRQQGGIMSRKQTRKIEKNFKTLLPHFVWWPLEKEN